MTHQHPMPPEAELREQARALTDEKILTTLRLRGPLSFGQLRRRLSDLAFRQLDAALKRLAKAQYIRTSESGAKVWRLTPAGLEQIPSLSAAESTASSFPSTAA